MKTYRKHNCTAKHHRYETFAKCIWRRAAWVTGEGPYVTVTHCTALTVMLHPTIDDARQALKFIDDLGCGHACRKDHDLIRLVLP